MLQLKVEFVLQRFSEPNILNKFNYDPIFTQYGSKQGEVFCAGFMVLNETE